MEMAGRQPVRGFKWLGSQHVHKGTHDTCTSCVLPGAHSACRHPQTLAEFRLCHLRVSGGPSPSELWQEEDRSELWLFLGGRKARSTYWR